MMPGLLRLDSRLRQAAVALALLLPIATGLVFAGTGPGPADGTRPAATTADAAEGAGLVSGPQGGAHDDAPRRVWLVPLAGQSMLMHALVLRPPGRGPFPLAVINHGSSQNATRRKRFAMPTYDTASRWFLARGYVVVLPLRPGHGTTAGPYFEDQGRCQTADYRRAGLATADSIQSAVDYLTAQSFVRKAGVVAIGHSAGGWGVLALASRNPQAVQAAINFGGGRGGEVDDKPRNNCAPERLVAAAGTFGRTARIPTLWLYGENDGHFAPALSGRMVEAFRGAGGRADYHLLPPIVADGHALIDSDAAVPLWGPIVERFLAAQRL
jgi:dienelactone hydrolase